MKTIYFSRKKTKINFQSQHFGVAKTFLPHPLLSHCGGGTSCPRCKSIQTTQRLKIMCTAQSPSRGTAHLRKYRSLIGWLISDRQDAAGERRRGGWRPSAPRRRQWIWRRRDCSFSGSGGWFRTVSFPCVSVD